MRLFPANSDYGLTSILAMGCGLLILFAVIQWQVMPNRGDPESPGKVVPLHDSAISQENTDRDDFILEPKESFLEIVERPLFLEGRRPIIDEVDEAVSALTNIAASKPSVKLMGVFSQANDLTALIADNQGTYSRVVKGDYIEEWQVEKILADRVLLESGNSNQELKLHKPRPKKPVSLSRRRANIRRPESNTRQNEPISANSPKQAPVKQKE